MFKSSLSLFLSKVYIQSLGCNFFPLTKQSVHNSHDILSFNSNILKQIDLLNQITKDNDEAMAELIQIDQSLFKSSKDLNTKLNNFTT